MSPLFTLLLTLSAAVPVPGVDTGRRAPNIVVILADDLGSNDVSYAGARDVATPNIDALAREGARFTAFYANSPVCSPTRAALLTGRDPDLMGVPGVIREGGGGVLKSDAPLLSAALGRLGYFSALVGKWHLGLGEPNTPLDRGFAFFHGFLGDMMDDYYSHLRHGQNYLRLDREPVVAEGHATDLFTQWALEFLRSRRASPSPFFLLLSYNAPHEPIQPTAEWVARVRRRSPGLSEKRANYAALVEQLDDGVGQVVKALRELPSDSVILFTSDNGGELAAGADNSPWRAGKQSMYEGGIRVPAALVWRGRITPGRVVDRACQTSDIFATALEVATGRPPSEGESFLPDALGLPRAPLERTLFWVQREGGRSEYAIRRGPWKLIRVVPPRALPSEELYDLASDPREEKNRLQAEDATARAIREQLASELDRHILSARPPGASDRKAKAKPPVKKPRIQGHPR